MARNLYRSYLYVILIIALGFSVYALVRLLDPLWRLTPLRPSYQTAPDRVEVVQALIFAVALLLVIAILGGIHYWLLRRDLRQEPTAGEDAVRSFFLNFSELVLALIAVFSLGQALILSESDNVATGLAALAGWLLVEWERKRLPVGSGLARLFQRLHVYGVQFILLFPLFGAVTHALYLLQVAWLLGPGLIEREAPCLSFTPCAEGSRLTVYLMQVLMQALWFFLIWSTYAYLNRRDVGSLLRRLFYAGSLTYTLFLVVDELAALVDLLLRFLGGLPITPGDLLTPPGALMSGVGGEQLAALPVGLLIAVASWFWLQYEIGLLPDPQQGRAFLRNGLLAIGAALLALLCWVGVARLLLTLLFTLFPTGPHPQLGDWIDGLAPLLVGLGTLPLDLRLRRRCQEAPESALLLRRGFLLAVIAAGALAAAIGGAVALYAWGTAALGVPLEHWPRLAQQGLAAALVGLVVTGLYLWRAFHEGLLRQGASPVPVAMPLSPRPEPAASVQTVPVAPDTSQSVPPTLESILARLQAQQITLEEAAAQIRALFGQAS